MRKPKTVVRAGMRFGKLTVVSLVRKDRRGKHWLCRCDCGNVKRIIGYNMATGNTKSCGCFRVEASRALGAKTVRHGHYRGDYPSPTWITWQAIKRRCLKTDDKDFKRYGARGISICARWLVFENFLADMGERPDGKTIDRIDNDGGYEPGNCRWATPKEQAANRRPPQSRKRQAFSLPPTARG